MSDKVVNGVGRTGVLVSVVRGKVTIDPGAAESVVSRDMLQYETLVEGAPKKSGVKYVAASGAKMDKLRGEACALTTRFFRSQMWANL